MNHLALVQNYYQKINAGIFDDSYFALFADNVELFYPKFGFAQGHEGIRKLGAAISNVIDSLQFDLDKFVYTISDERIAVEICESGTVKSGKHFPDNKNSFGRFCNVFEFKNGKISRMYCYGDPDLSGEDETRAALFQSS